jgi:hypothetical protein
VDIFYQSSFDAETHVELSLVQEFQNSSLTKGIFSKKLYYSLQLSFCLILSKVKPTYKTISWNGNRVIFVWCFYKRRSGDKNKLFMFLKRSFKDTYYCFVDLIKRRRHVSVAGFVGIMLITHKNSLIDLIIFQDILINLWTWTQNSESQSM